MAGQRQFIDSLGRSISLPSVPHRLVSLVPSMTEVLFKFGRGPDVVGITDYCTQPVHEVVHKTRVGGTKNPAVDHIQELQPQLVFAVAEENRQPDVEQLEAAGVPVYVFEPRTVRDGIDLLWRIAELLDCLSDVQWMIEEIEHVYADTLETVAQRDRVRVFCPIWKDPYMTINENTYVHDMIRRCGGDNIFAQRHRRFPLAADLGQQPKRTASRYTDQDRRYPRVSLEEMASLYPDVVLLPDEPYVFTQSDVSDFLPYSDSPAVQHERIHLIDGKVISWYGTRIGQSLRTLEQLLAL